MSETNMVSGYALRVDGVREYMRSQLTPEDFDEVEDELYDNIALIDNNPRYIMDGTRSEYVLVIIESYSPDFYGESNGLCNLKKLKKMDKRLKAKVDKDNISYENDVVYFFNAWHNSSDAPNIFNEEKT